MPITDVAPNEVWLAWVSSSRTPLIAEFVVLAETAVGDAQTNPTTSSRRHRAEHGDAQGRRRLCHCGADRRAEHRRAAINLKATAERLQARLGLRRSNAARPHKNKKREAKRPGKGDRAKWKKDADATS
jgi:hypothetical protein